MEYFAFWLKKNQCKSENENERKHLSLVQKAFKLYFVFMIALFFFFFSVTVSTLLSAGPNLAITLQKIIHCLTVHILPGELAGYDLQKC